MSIEDLFDKELGGIKEEMAISKLPRAIAITHHCGSLYKLYTDGTLFCWKGSEWHKHDDDNYLKEKLEEIQKGLDNS